MWWYGFARISSYRCTTVGFRWFSLVGYHGIVSVGSNEFQEQDAIGSDCRIDGPEQGNRKNSMFFWQKPLKKIKKYIFLLTSTSSIISHIQNWKKILLEFSLSVPYKNTFLSFLTVIKLMKERIHDSSVNIFLLIEIRFSISFESGGG